MKKSPGSVTMSPSFNKSFQEHSSTKWAYLHLQIHMYVSLYEPIKEQKHSNLCELSNDVKMITAHSYHLKVALL